MPAPTPLTVRVRTEPGAAARYRRRSREEHHKPPQQQLAVKIFAATEAKYRRSDLRRAQRSSEPANFRQSSPCSAPANGAPGRRHRAAGRQAPARPAPLASSSATNRVSWHETTDLPQPSRADAAGADDGGERGEELGV